MKHVLNTLKAVVALGLLFLGTPAHAQLSGCIIATVNNIGCVKPDGSSITINAGTISAAGFSGGVLGPASGGTGVANTGTITVGGNLVTGGALTIANLTTTNQLLVVTSSGNVGSTATPTVTSLTIGAGSAITSSGAGGSLGTGAFATAYSLPTATSSTLGGVKPDGTTITNSTGAISVTYGTTAGTAAQGNDARLGAGAVTGAIKSNGSNSFGQAAAADLSDTTVASSWTPSDGSGAGLTFSPATGYYYKVGKTVTIVFQIGWPVTANTNQIQINGLPATALALGPNQFCYFGYNPVSASDVGQINAGTSSMFIVLQNTNGVIQNVAFSNKTIFGSCTYISA